MDISFSDFSTTPIILSFTGFYSPVMGFRFLPPPPIRLSLAFLFWVMVEIPLSSSYNLYTSCNNTFDCGGINGVGFPFWGGSRPEGCGHPSLKLSCDVRTTSINITGVNYRVLELTEATQTLTIARADFADDLCPPKFLNTTLDYNLFDMVPGFQNISLIYCISSSGHLAGQFNCSSFQFGYIQAGAVGPLFCNASVVIPISLLGNILDSSRALQAIQQGFDVQWKVDKENCDKCIKSKGICGYDLSSNQTTCYCQGQVKGSDSCPVMNTGAPTPSPGADDEQYMNCNSTFQCAHISNLSYPFWGDNRPSYCGHPEFQLSCSGEVPLINIASTRYRVLEIDGANTLKVSRLDYWEDVCPQYLVNSTLNETSFSYTSTSQELILFYGCSGFNLIPSSTITTRFNCTINGTDYANFFVTQNSVSADVVGQMTVLCNGNVHVWIFESEIPTLASNMVKDSLIGSIDAGFGLEWKINTSDLCDECKRSEGLCGSDLYSGAFTCFCKNGSSSSTCGSTEGNKSVKAPIIIGVSVGGAAILGLLFGCRVAFVRQKRKKLAFQSKSKDLLPSPPSSNGISSASTNFTKSTPSYPYSKFSSEKGGSKSNYFGAQLFSYEELEEATDNFHASKELGDGGFGTVYYGKLRDNRAVAVKRLYEHNLKRVEQFKNEVEILTGLQHPNLVKLYGCTSKHSQELLLVYEFVSNGTVADHLNGNRANSGLLTVPLRLRIAIETADALAYLHRSDIIHRDVKTDNILLDHNFHVKVADFGLSRLFPTNVTHVSTAPQGTPGYVDPEYYQCYHLTDKSDVYSFGVVLIELISSLPAVDTSRHRSDINLANMAVNKIKNHALVELVDPSLGFENDYAVRRIITLIAELALQCLQLERDARPSMSKVLEALRGLESEELATRKPEVVDFGDDDVGLLRNMPSPFSPDDFVTEKWMKMVNRTM